MRKAFLETPVPVLISTILLLCAAGVKAAHPQVAEAPFSQKQGKPLLSKSNPALALGDYLFGLQSYDEAITEYKRFLFFHPDVPRASDAFHKIGLAYRSQRRWTEAIEAMNVAIQRTAEAELKSERRIDLAVTMIASGDYSFALLELLKVSKRHPSGRLRQRAIFLQGVAHLYMFNWKSARQAFKAYFDAIPGSRPKAKMIDALFDEAIHRPQKSVTVARVLSTILPGAGQTYVGDWKNGLNALVLNVLVGFVSVDAVLDKRYQDAVFSGVFLFLRYYLGNRYRAGEAAKQFNDRSDRGHAAKILQALHSLN